jgi:hypothetical protein
MKHPDITDDDLGTLGGPECVRHLPDECDALWI